MIAGDTCWGVRPHQVRLLYLHCNGDRSNGNSLDRWCFSYFNRVKCFKRFWLCNFCIIRMLLRVRSLSNYTYRNAQQASQQQGRTAQGVAGS